MCTVRKVYTSVLELVSLQGILTSQGLLDKGYKGFLGFLNHSTLNVHIFLIFEIFKLKAQY